MKYILCTFFFFFSFSVMAEKFVSIEPYASAAFNPSEGQVQIIPVMSLEKGRISLSIYSPDGDLIRTLAPVESKAKGIVNILWDGKNTEGQIIPNEAYTPVITFVGKDNKQTIYDPRMFSGGEEFTLQPTIDAQNNIIFNLEKPSRILARAGIKSGPMMNSIANWQVRGVGRNLISWNGYDQDNIVNLIASDELALLVAGFYLPDHTIIAIGNDGVNFIDEKRNNRVLSLIPDLSTVSFERDKQRISRHYYLPRTVEIDPRVSLTIVNELEKNKEGLPIVSEPILLRVDMNKDDQWAMQQSLYEVAFFLNYRFLSEEEQGYVPLTWRWNPNGLTSGVHTLTVNVSGFEGQVGVRTIQVFIPENN